MRKVCQRAGLQAAEVEDAGGTQPFIQQSNETDWEFLWRLANRVGCEVVVLDKELRFRKRGGGDAGGEPITLRYGEELLTFRPRLTGVQQVDEVVVRSWDHTAKRAIEATAKPEPTRSAIGVGRDTVASALGGGAITISDAPVGNQEEADALAKTVMARITNGFLEAEGTCRGDAEDAGGLDAEGRGRRHPLQRHLPGHLHGPRVPRGEGLRDPLPRLRRLRAQPGRPAHARPSARAGSRAACRWRSSPRTTTRRASAGCA